MSGACSGWVLDNGPEDLRQLVVLLAVADRADEWGGNSRQSVRTLARRARCSEGHARRVLLDLVRDGWLEALIRRPASTVYTVAGYAAEANSRAVQNELADVANRAPIAHPVGAINRAHRMRDERIERENKGGYAEMRPPPLPFQQIEDDQLSTEDQLERLRATRRAMGS